MKADENMPEKVFTVRNMTLGDGIPKICVPVTARNIDELDQQCRRIAEVPYDMIELRADYFESDAIPELQILRQKFKDTPLLFTFRTAKEGGERDISADDYEELNLKAASGGCADFTDLEMSFPEERLKKLTKRIQACKVRVIASSHDFSCTPDCGTIIRLMRKMQELGADVSKIAVMPQSEKDVMVLMEAALSMKEQYADRPFIVMSMGKLGGITRLSGALTGSAVTFASAGAASAPGQMDAALVSRVLSALKQ